MKDKIITAKKKIKFDFLPENITSFNYADMILPSLKRTQPTTAFQLAETLHCSDTTTRIHLDRLVRKGLAKFRYGTVRGGTKFKAFKVYYIDAKVLKQ